MGGRPEGIISPITFDLIFENLFVMHILMLYFDLDKFDLHMQKAFLAFLWDMASVPLFDKVF